MIIDAVGIVAIIAAVIFLFSLAENIMAMLERLLYIGIVVAVVATICGFILGMSVGAAGGISSIVSVIAGIWLYYQGDSQSEQPKKIQKQPQKVKKQYSAASENKKRHAKFACLFFC